MVVERLNAVSSLTRLPLPKPGEAGHPCIVAKPRYTVTGNYQHIVV